MSLTSTAVGASDRSDTKPNTDYEMNTRLSFNLKHLTTSLRLPFLFFYTEKTRLKPFCTYCPTTSILKMNSCPVDSDQSNKTTDSCIIVKLHFIPAVPSHMGFLYMFIPASALHLKVSYDRGDLRNMCSRLTSYQLMEQNESVTEEGNS